MKRFAMMLAVMTPALAWSDGGVIPPVDDPLVIKECGGCHMVFPAAMLPARSWEKLMAGLKEHFGENAALDDATRQAITTWLTSQAGDTGGSRWGRGMIRGIGPQEAPLRISETPYWRHEHEREVSPAAFARPEVKSKANCVACHQQAARGLWEDEGLEQWERGERHERRR